MEAEGYEPAISRALEGIEGIDPGERCALCGGRYDEAKNSAVIPFLGTEYSITLADGEAASSAGPASTVRRLILLHYLARSRGTRPSGDMVTFREVPEGNFYFSSFRARVLEPFLSAFGRDPDVLRDKGNALGWRVSDVGDVSLMTDALPLVPIRFVLWYGDDELEPEAGVHFDPTVQDHLHTEDVALIAEEAVRVLTGEG